MNPHIAAVVACALLAFADHASGQTAGAPDARSWLERPRLTGSWGGVRPWLSDRGIEFDASYTTGFWSNVRGGLETGIRYEGFADWGLDVDLERLVGWPGALFSVDWHSWHGGQPSADLVGQFGNDAVSANEAAKSIRFYHLYLQQKLWNDKLLIRVGQLASDDDFPDSPYIDAFLNAAFGSLAAGRTLPIAPFYPLAAPGVFAQLRLSEHWTLKVGAYTADPGLDEPENWGFDWGFDDGASLAAALRAHASPFGLSATYTLGSLVTTATVNDFESGGTSDGGYTLFARVDQALLENEQQGVRVGSMVRAGVVPESDLALVRWYIDAALVWYAPIPGRDRDSAAIGIAYTDFGNDFTSSLRAAGDDITGHEIVIEMSYEAQVNGWLTAQPDLQIIVDPQFSRRTAVVIGLQFVLSL